MNSERRPAILTKVFRDIVCNALRADEDEHLRILVADDIEMLQQLSSFFEVGADFDDLCDVMISRELHRTNSHLNKIVQEVLQKTAMRCA